MRIVRDESGPPGEGTIVSGVVAAGLVAMARLWPFDRYPLGACPVRTRFHLPCATCGMTRAFVAMTRSEIGAAFRVSPLGAIGCLVAMGLALHLFARLTWMRTGVRAQLTRRESTWLARLALAALAVNWLYLLRTGAAD